mmetsp:Transcript_44627/g.100769  ORF Transcript_44627/g.100769 Transcript_44627/m.100769 type:complete len:315 (+) Transcript_44627:3-947(+)
MGQGGVIYQDLDNSECSASEVFFDLANEMQIKYRLKDRPDTLVSVSQDPGIENSTGGIVWETAYLLATFLEDKTPPIRKGSRVLEVGAGCGLLGIVMAHLGHSVICTEAREPLPILENNIEAAQDAIARAQGSCRAELLRWDFPEDRAPLLEKEGGKKFDVILGTDVFFEKKLVAPLLETISSLSHEETEVWLCFQERCADAHAELLHLAPKFFARVVDQSDILQHKSEAAKQLDCFLLCLKDCTLDGYEAARNERPEETRADGGHEPEPNDKDSDGDCETEKRGRAFDEDRHQDAGMPVERKKPKRKKRLKKG